MERRRRDWPDDGLGGPGAGRVRAATAEAGEAARRGAVAPSLPTMRAWLPEAARSLPVRSAAALSRPLQRKDLCSPFC